MRRGRWWWAVLVAGCATRPAVRPTTPEDTEQAARTADPDLRAIADAIDPGPQAPLLAALPEWLKTWIGATPDRTPAGREIREALLAWEKLGPNGGQEFIPALLSVGRGLVLAEQAIAAGTDDAELSLALSRAYQILSNPALASERGAFQQILEVMSAAALQAEQSGGPTIDVAAAMTALREVLRRAPLLHRRTAAELLRRHADHPEIPRVLGRLAEHEAWTQNFSSALALRNAAMKRLGARATGPDHLDLAWTCYHALDPACGDDALARAEALGPERPDEERAVAAFARRVEALRTTAVQTRRALALAEDPRVKDPQQPDLAPALERGHLLVVLGHHDDARALYERLRAAHPTDARPVAGLAKAVFSDGGDLSGASAWIERARDLGQRDREFYEVALGVLGAKLMTEVMPAAIRNSSATPQSVMQGLLDDMHEYASGFLAYEPGRASVVLALEEVARAVLPLLEAKDPDLSTKALAVLKARARALLAKYPESADVRRLAYLMAHFIDDRDEALALARAPLGGALTGDPALRFARAQAWLHVVLRHEIVAELTEVLAEITTMPGEDDVARRTLQAVALAAQFRGNGDRAAGLAAQARFEAIAGEAETPAELRVMALCNHGTLTSWLGDDDAAREIYNQALASSTSALPVLANFAALFTIHGAREAQLGEVFEKAAREGATTPLQLHALAWQHTRAKAGLGDVALTQQAFVDKLAAARGDSGDFDPGRWGVMSTGNWNLGLQYQATVGFAIANQATTTTWLMLLSPDWEPLVAAADAASKPAKRGKQKPAAAKRG